MNTAINEDQFVRTWRALGRCPWCKQPTKDWEPLYTPSWFATMRDLRIDPFSGHLLSCREVPVPTVFGVQSSGV
jgi:hypothetical protein